jgi:hypothetical protein
MSEGIARAAAQRARSTAHDITAACWLLPDRLRPVRQHRTRHRGLAGGYTGARIHSGLTDTLIRRIGRSPGSQECRCPRRKDAPAPGCRGTPPQPACPLSGAGRAGSRVSRAGRLPASQFGVDSGQVGLNRSADRGVGPG